MSATSWLVWCPFSHYREEAMFRWAAAAVCASLNMVILYSPSLSGKNVLANLRVTHVKISFWWLTCQDRWQPKKIYGLVLKIPVQLLLDPEASESLRYYNLDVKDPLVLKVQPGMVVPRSLGSTVQKSLHLSFQRSMSYWTWLPRTFRAAAITLRATHPFLCRILVVRGPTRDVKPGLESLLGRAVGEGQHAG